MHAKHGRASLNRLLKNRSHQVRSCAVPKAVEPHSYNTDRQMSLQTDMTHTRMNAPHHKPSHHNMSSCLPPPPPPLDRHSPTVDDLLLQPEPPQHTTEEPHRCGQTLVQRTRCRRRTSLGGVELQVPAVQLHVSRNGVVRTKAAHHHHTLVCDRPAVVKPAAHCEDILASEPITHQREVAIVADINASPEHHSVFQTVACSQATDQPPYQSRRERGKEIETGVIHAEVDSGIVSVVAHLIRIITLQPIIIIMLHPITSTHAFSFRRWQYLSAQAQSTSDQREGHDLHQRQVLGGRLRAQMSGHPPGRDH
mmetsp:Transcript_5046/g.13734  ORF Transcript_5046/g.13734 Transcript_5046/m.13734 type:complete len:309 (+) Transcript_5046:689-1615(+)